MQTTSTPLTAFHSAIRAMLDAEDHEAPVAYDINERIKVIIDRPMRRGTAIMRSPTDPSRGVPADGKLLGFVTRDVVVGGPTVIQRASGGELPFAAGDECSLELDDAFVCEGDAYIVTSIGPEAIDNSTPARTRCSFRNGRTCGAQGGDDAIYRLANNSGLPNSCLASDGDGPRIRLESLRR